MERQREIWGCGDGERVKGYPCLVVLVKYVRSLMLAVAAGFDVAEICLCYTLAFTRMHAYTYEGERNELY